MREFPMSVILAVRDDVRRMFLAVRSLWTMGGPRLGLGLGLGLGYASKLNRCLCL